MDHTDITNKNTNLWLKQICDELGWTARNAALIALRAVLQPLSARLTLQETAQPVAQLPVLIRGWYYEGWHPEVQPVKYNRADFLA
jgi:uncharacterized protein (DUF2267 family)